MRNCIYRESIIYLPTKFSRTELFPADCPPTTAICGKFNCMWTPIEVKASCSLLTIGINFSIPVFPDILVELLPLCTTINTKNMKNTCLLPHRIINTDWQDWLADTQLQTITVRNSRLNVLEWGCIYMWNVFVQKFFVDIRSYRTCLVIA